jgi:hypothetical protein
MDIVVAYYKKQFQKLLGKFEALSKTMKTSGTIINWFLGQEPNM